VAGGPISVRHDADHDVVDGFLHGLVLVVSADGGEGVDQARGVLPRAVRQPEQRPPLAQYTRQQGQPAAARAATGSRGHQVADLVAYERRQETAQDGHDDAAGFAWCARPAGIVQHLFRAFVSAHRSSRPTLGSRVRLRAPGRQADAGLRGWLRRRTHQHVVDERPGYGHPPCDPAGRPFGTSDDVPTRAARVSVNGFIQPVVPAVPQAPGVMDR
jgi:hypothetical protein